MVDYIEIHLLEKLDYKTDLSAGYIPATPVFLEKKTVYENFKYALKNWGYDDGEIESKINKVIISYSLEKIKDTKIKDLSLEEKYVLSLIRLSFRELDLLMVDNIFDNLTPTTFEVVMTLIKELTTKKTTLILATTKEEIADRLCKRKLYFKYGSMVKSLTD